MCENDNTELRDLLVESLTQNGALAKIRAELRAQVYLTLEDELDLRKEETKQYFCRNDDTAILFLIYDFLSYNNFDYTLSVFEAETDFSSNKTFQNRNDFFKSFSIENKLHSTPLLVQVFQIYKEAASKKITKLDATYELGQNSVSQQEVVQNENKSPEFPDIIEITNLKIDAFTNFDNDKNENHIVEHKFSDDISKSEISEEIHLASSRNNSQSNSHELFEINNIANTRNIENIDLNTSDLILFKDDTPERLQLTNTKQNTKEIPNFLEESVVFENVEKNIEIMSSSPLNNTAYSTNLMKFDDSLSDISLVKTPEQTNTEMQNKLNESDFHVDVIDNKTIQSTIEVPVESNLNKTNVLSNVSEKKNAKAKETDSSISSEDMPLCVDLPIRNVPKQKQNSINATSLPSFYLNVSNMDGFELELDSLDNYEEDILSLSTSKSNKDSDMISSAVINPKSHLEKNQFVDHGSDRGPFTVNTDQENTDPEKCSIGDGPQVLNDNKILETEGRTDM